MAALANMAIATTSPRIVFLLVRFNEPSQRVRPSLLPIQNLANRRRLRKLPTAVENLRSRIIKSHRIVPALRDRQTIRNFPVATAPNWIANEPSSLFFAVMLMPEGAHICPSNTSVSTP
jgi:hypothetical protein